VKRQLIFGNFRSKDVHSNGKGSVFEKGFNKKVIWGWKKLFNFIKEATMPDPIKGQNYLEQNCCAVMFKFQARVD
jgi:hypothetical protein